MQTTATASASDSPHYLSDELNDLASADDALWKFIQRASLDGVWYWDLEKPENLYISPEYWQCLGIDPASRRHHPDEFIAVVFEEDLGNVVGNLEAHYADPNVPYEQTVRFKHIDGSTVWVRCRGLAIRNAEGKAIRMLGAHNNITQAKLAELAAVEQAEKLAQAYEDLKHLTYRVAHDLSAPINTIEMLINEIKADPDNPLSDDQNDLCQIAQRTTGRTKQSLRDLLAFSRSLHATDTRVDTDIREIVEEATGNLKALISERGADIELGGLCSAPVDHGQMVSVLQNLIANAIRYARPNEAPRIQIEATRPNIQSESPYQ